MHAILASFGTDGDVFPYIGLGTVLRSRGHRVTLLANASYESVAASHGLDFRILVSDQETEQMLASPDAWHPLKSMLSGKRWVVRVMGRQYPLLAELAKEDDAVLVASPIVFGARLVEEKLARPLASIVLQPWMIASVIDPPVFAGGLGLPRRAPRIVGKFYWRLVDAVGDALIGRHLNRIRVALNLNPVRRLFQWCLSPARVIGLFPEWYGPPQTDWIPQIRLAGFPLYDGQLKASLPPAVLEFCRAGDPPVAFTFGTGMMHATRLFGAAVEACRMLGVRGIFLTKHRHQLPDSLPRFIQHSEFIPFRELFPHCAAVVHHGGIGTVAKAFAAGVPQLVLPFAYDQLDNATRVKRLGAGDRLKSSQRSGTHIADALRRLMTSKTQARCRELAAHFREDGALEKAVQWVEELCSSPRVVLTEPIQS